MSAPVLAFPRANGKPRATRAAQKKEEERGPADVLFNIVKGSLDDVSDADIDRFFALLVDRYGTDFDRNLAYMRLHRPSYVGVLERLLVTAVRDHQQEGDAS